MMPDLLVYLLKMNGALLVFAVVYYALLRRLTFHTLNRWYLLGAIAFSALYPLVDVAALWPQPVALSEELPVWLPLWSETPVVAPAPAPVDYYGWVISLYWIGVVVFAGQLLLQAASLWRLHRASVPASAGLPFRQVADVVTPFSFWQSIYLNPAQHQPSELPAILLHEQVHVRQWHTLDVLLGQMLRVFCWLNPAAWLLLRAMQENLEFIADRTVLQAGQVDSKLYQYSLVRLSTLAQGPALVIPFTFHPLKTRIQMMNSRPSSTRQLLRYAAGVSLLFVAAVVGATPKASETRQSNVLNQTSQPLLATPTVGAEPLYFLDGKPINKTELDKLDPKSISHMMVLKKEEALRSFGPGATAGAILVVTKGKENSKEVLAFMKEHNMTLTPASPEVKKITAAVVDGKGLSTDDLGGRLLIVNGQEAPASASKIEAGRLQGVGVLEAEKATAKYGAKGKNGAVIITTR